MSQAASLPVFVSPVWAGPTNAAIDESLCTDPASSGVTFRWDGSESIYDGVTEGYAAGSYCRITVTLDDGTTESVYIGLR